MNECYECVKPQNIVKETSDSVEPCDGSGHKFSCSNCKKYCRVVNIAKSRTEHYCRGRRMAVKAVDWLKVVGCASFRDDVIGNNK